MKQAKPIIKDLLDIYRYRYFNGNKPIENVAVQGALDQLPPLLPDDAYDAAICALLALSMADQEGVTNLPHLEGPADKGIDDAVLQAEGWIYHWK